MHWIALQPLPEVLTSAGSDLEVAGPADVYAPWAGGRCSSRPGGRGLTMRCCWRCRPANACGAARARLRQALLAANRLPAPSGMPRRSHP